MDTVLSQASIWCRETDAFLDLWPMIKYLDIYFHTYETEFGLFLAMLEHSVSPMGWDISHATLKLISELQVTPFFTITRNTEWRLGKVVMRRKRLKNKEMTNDK